MAVKWTLKMLLPCLALWALPACDDGGSDGDGAGGAGGAQVDQGGAGGMGGAGAEGGMGGAGGAGGEGGEGGASAQCTPHEVPCEDASFLALDLKDRVSTGVVNNTADPAGGFVTDLDTTGGGFQPTESYTYLRFTTAGLEPVALNDEDAFIDDTWHLAARRYVLRLNSGVSGPGCVTAGRTAPRTEFDALDAVPEQVMFFPEEYMTDSCDIVPDGSGLPSPGTVLSTYWTYAACVQMTGNVYIVDLGDGRRVKLRVDQYYATENQRVCDDTGSAGMPSNSGQMKLRWAFLE